MMDADDAILDSSPHDGDMPVARSVKCVNCAVNGEVNCPDHTSVAALRRPVTDSPGLDFEKAHSSAVLGDHGEEDDRIFEAALNTQYRDAVAQARREERERLAAACEAEAAKGRYPEEMRLAATFIRTRSSV